MHLNLQASVQMSTTLFLVMRGVVRLLFLIGGPFQEGAREGGDESPFNKGPPTTRKPRRNQSTCRDDGNISSVDFVCTEVVYESGRRQKLGGA